MAKTRVSARINAGARAKNSARENSVRIIGGQFRRRLLRFPDSIGLRPTPGRVRETLFNWLGQDLSAWRCLDLFAGSGALGFEAASRGAAQVVLVESAPRVLGALEANRAALQHPPSLQIWRGDALQYLDSATTKFDLVFIDPPYRQGWLERILAKLERVTTPESLLYVEAESALATFGPWRCQRHGVAGEVHYHLMQQEIQ